MSSRSPTKRPGGLAGGGGPFAAPFGVSALAGLPRLPRAPAYPRMLLLQLAAAATLVAALSLWGRSAPLPPTDVVALDDAAPALAAAGKATVIITAFKLLGARPRFLRRAMRHYTAPDMAPLIDKVILVWNGPPGAAPTFPGVLTLSMPNNSLNHRWTHPIEYVSTEAVLNTDDDLIVTREGVACLLAAWAAGPRDALVGPFVRTYESPRKFVIREIVDARRWMFVLPRVMVLSRRVMELYRDVLGRDVKHYINWQAGHCDDVALNLLMANQTMAPPRRVVLPPQSVVDLFDCRFDVDEDNAVGGLGMNKHRQWRRNRCLAWLLERHAEWSGGAEVPSTNAFTGCTVRRDDPPPPLAEAFPAMKFPLDCDNI